MEQNEFDLSLEFFEKCLNVARSSDDKIIQAECYQQIGMIYDTQGDIENALEHREKFLHFTVQAGDREK